MQIDWDPTTLQKVVNGVKYLMPGWQIWLGDDNENNETPALHIVSCTPDSYHPEKKIYVNHSFLVPLATYNERTWKIWILECYCKVWRHEIGEMLLFDGVREFAPHHGNGEDPYITWHIGDVVDTQVRAGEDKQEFDFNTVVTRIEGGFHHTYDPECPPGCYGQLEECHYKSEDGA